MDILPGDRSDDQRVSAWRLMKTGRSLTKDGTTLFLSPVHTGDYSRRIRRQWSVLATVAEFGDSHWFWRLSTIVASVDRALRKRRV